MNWMRHRLHYLNDITKGSEWYNGPSCPEEEKSKKLEQPDNIIKHFAEHLLCSWFQRIATAYYLFFPSQLLSQPNSPAPPSPPHMDLEQQKQSPSFFGALSPLLLPATSVVMKEPPGYEEAVKQQPKSSEVRITVLLGQIRKPLGVDLSFLQIILIFLEFIYWIDPLCTIEGYLLPFFIYSLHSRKDAGKTLG